MRAFFMTNFRWLKEKFGLFVDFEFLRKWALGAPTNRFPFIVWKKSSNGKWLKTTFEINAHVPVFRAEMLVMQYVLSSSRHVVTPLICIQFCVWLGLFVDRWWLKEVRYAPDFLSNCSTRVTQAVPGITGSPSKRICRGTLSQKTRNWSIWQAAHGYVANDLAQPAHVFAPESWLARSVWGPTRLRLCQPSLF